MVALDGTVIAFDGEANRLFYDRGQVTTQLITSGKVTTNSELARRFLNSISLSANGASAPPAAAAPTAAPPAPVAPASNTPVSSGASTFPMEDAKPGSEPK